MDTLYWLAGANAVVWLGLGFYVAFLAGRERALARRLDQWEGDRRGR